ncbi:MAG: hypothetical protein Q9175_005730 [Cornicularia normoerica]
MILLTALVLALPSTTIISALTLNSPSLILAGSAIANVTSSNYIHQCDGTAYGSNLNSASCTEALNEINASLTMEQTYGQRYTGPFDVKLPKRYISSDGLCVIQPSIIPGESSARASPQEVAFAAGYIIDQCVNARPSTGGRVRDIGQDSYRHQRSKADAVSRG